MKEEACRRHGHFFHGYTMRINTALVFVWFLLPSSYTALSKVSDLIDDEKNGRKMRIITSDILYRQKLGGIQSGYKIIFADWAGNKVVSE